MGAVQKSSMTESRFQGRKLFLKIYGVAQIYGVLNVLGLCLPTPFCPVSISHHANSHYYWVDLIIQPYVASLTTVLE